MGYDKNSVNSENVKIWKGPIKIQYSPANSAPHKSAYLLQLFDSIRMFYSAA